MRKRTLLFFLLASAAAVVLAMACGPSGFTSEDLINSVRILATRADNDKSFAKPGDVVTLEALTVDGRANKTPPAVMYWFPVLCEDPADDAYYECFAPLLGVDAGGGGFVLPGAGGEDGGTSPTSPSITSLFGPDAGPTNLTPVLPTGPFTFTVPADAIARHPVVPGAPAPYGLIIVFNIACAGQVWTQPVNPAAGPQQIPITCLDSSMNPLGADQYVIGFTRVYVYETKTNANPVIDGFLFNGIETFAEDAGGESRARSASRCPLAPATTATAFRSTWTSRSRAGRPIRR